MVQIAINGSLLRSLVLLKRLLKKVTPTEFDFGLIEMMATKRSLLRSSISFDDVYKSSLLSSDFHVLIDLFKQVATCPYNAAFESTFIDLCRGGDHKPITGEIMLIK